MESSYEGRLETIFREEFSHAKGMTYLDHAGATLYSSRQLEEHMKDLTSHLYGNPHSGNPSSQLSTDTIEGVRELILQHFNTDSTHYDVIFTSGCTAALKLLAESFPWSGAGVRRKSHEKGNNDSTETTCASSHNEEIECKNDTQQSGLGDERTHQASLTGLRGKGILPAEIHTELKTSPQHTEVTYLSDAGATTEDVTNLSYDGSSVFCYLEDNHTSVVGMRELAQHHGARVVCTTTQNIQSQTNTITEHSSSPTSDGSNSRENRSSYHLFAYPAQSNFSGQKYPLAWCKDLPSGEVYISGLENLAGMWLVALDAASYVCTSPLDLTANPAHFVALSFYKMFGYPTGLGALLVRSDCAHLLRNDYYGGGTVLATVSRTGFHIPRSQLHERFEDGTVSFLSILALKYGFNTLTRIGRSMQDISQHTFSIARYVYESLLKMCYSNGNKVCQLYCETGFENQSVQGPIINFNLVKPDGQVIGYSVVDCLATVHNIHLRTGCFCNTGACMTHLKMSAERIEKNLKAGHVCGDAMDIVDGHPTGSVRISFGYMSMMADARKFIDFITNTFLIPEEKRTTEGVRASDVVSWSVSGHPGEGSHQGSGQDEGSSSDLLQAGCASISSPPPTAYPWLKVGHQVEAFTKEGNWQIVGTLSKLYLYPVKSCAGFSVKVWPLSSKGLLYDRDWMVLSQHNSVLSQKQESKLCLVQPSVDIETEKLILRANGYGSVELPLKVESVRCARSEESGPAMVSSSPLVRLCGDKVSALECCEETSLWLCKLLNRQCRLVKQNPNHQRLSKAKQDNTTSSDTPLSLANEAQYLFISDASVQQLLGDIYGSSMEFGELNVDSLTERFRPNLVLSAGSGIPPYAEEHWEMIKIGKAQFKVVGGCSRCQMICVDQSTGMRTPESLRTLTSLRGSKALFGVYLTLLTSPDLH